MITYFDNFELDLDLQPGNFCYVFGGENSTGKTYLYKLFRAAMSSNKTKDNFLGLTYNPTWKKDYYIENLQRFTGQYVMIDRFDLYYDHEIAQAAIKENRVVMMDLKNYVLMRKLPVRGASIEFDSWRMSIHRV